MSFLATKFKNTLKSDIIYDSEIFKTYCRERAERAGKISFKIQERFELCAIQSRGEVPYDRST